MLAFGQGDESVFALRGAEIAAAARADKTIDENVTIQRSLDRAVAVLVGEAEKSMQSGSAKLVEDLGRNRMLLMIVAAASLLVAGGIGVFYVQRRLVRRLTSIGDAMRRLSSGETDLDGAGRGRPRRDRRDGALARSVPLGRDRPPHDGGAPGERAGGAARARRRDRADDRRIPRDRHLGDRGGERQRRAHGDDRAHALEHRGGGRQPGARGLRLLGADLVERAQRRGRDRGARRLDPRNQRSGEPGEQRGRARHRDRAERRSAGRAIVERREPHRRRDQAHPRDRRADQPAGAQRHHRGGARGRSRARLRGRRLGGEDAREPDRQGDRGDFRRRSARSRARPRRRSRRSARSPA